MATEEPPTNVGDSQGVRRVSAPFLRDRTTWLAYLLLAYIAFLPSTLGPAMPFLRAELGLSYTLGALHISIMALGMALAGLVGARLSGWLGRANLIRLAGACTVLGSLGLVLGRQVSLTLPGALLMGFGGSSIQVMVQAILSDWKGEQRAVALTEANIGASLSTTAGPFCVATFQSLGLSWRFVPALAMIFLLAIAAAFRGAPVPPAPRAGQRQCALARRLPRLFWLCWGLILLVVAGEWSLMFWSADYLVQWVGFSRVAAAGVVGVFFAAMVLGRVAGSRLARRRPLAEILLGALVLSLGGFPLFWLGRQAAVNVAGLLLCGLGVANLFPLLMTIAVGLAPQQADLASSRVTFGAGLAGLSGPLLLGALADRAGIWSAYGVVLALIVLALAGVMHLKRALGPASSG